MTSSERIRTALFGGSFNPIHKGHVALARQLIREGRTDEVWLMVSPHNPLKTQGGLLDEQARLRLARLAVEGEDGVSVSDFEFHLPRPSFTWTTLLALREACPDREFSLLIGGDNWLVFDRWAHHEEILANHEIWVYPREGCAIDAAGLPPQVHLLEAPLFLWSSTMIRQRISAGEDCSGMLPQRVGDEILACGYYAKETQTHNHTHTD